MQRASSSSTTSFRDTGDMKDSKWNDSLSVISSLPGESNDDSEVRSMTAKGINHLCSELLELKAEANGDFHRIIISSYQSFSRIFEEIKGMQDDLILLKSHISTQTKTVKDLMDDIVTKIDSEDKADTSPEVSECIEISCLYNLEARIYDVSKALDTLIYENKIDEALDIIKIEDDNFQRLKVDQNYPSDILMLYECVIFDNKSRIKLRLERISENTITPASEPHEAATEL